MASSTNDRIGIEEEKLEMNDPPVIRWIKVRDAAGLFWSNNPKLHDIGSIVESLKKYGLQSLAKFDATLTNVSGSKGAIKAGNGRLEALHWMEQDGNYELPKGLALTDIGEWVVPILFGTNAENDSIAAAYAIDDNNLVMSGGDFTAFDMARLWDDGRYKEVVGRLGAGGEFPVTVDAEALESVLAPWGRPEDVEFAEYDEGVAGDVEFVECPKCGHEFPP